MPLEPEIEPFIAESEAFLPPDYVNAPLAEQRRRYDDLCRAYDFGRPAGVTVEDRRVPGPGGEVPVRIYRPAGGGIRNGPCAGVVFMHGGSWYLGGLASHDSIAAELAEGAGVTLVAVDYRLAPEHPFPAGFDDSYAVLEWVSKEAAALRIDSARLGVAGDSAGGNLAAALCLASRVRGGPPIRAQLLVYPVLDRHDPGRPDPDDQPLLSAGEIGFALRGYLGGTGTTDDPFAAPLLAEDFSGLPPAAIVAAQYDPLAADAEAYAARLAEAGVPLDFHLASGIVHGFLRARRTSPASARAFTWLCDRARALLGA